MLCAIALSIKKKIGSQFLDVTVSDCRLLLPVNGVRLLFKLNYDYCQKCSEVKEIKEKSLNKEDGFTFENPQFLLNEPGLDLLGGTHCMLSCSANFRTS